MGKGVLHVQVWTVLTTIINPRRACAARVTVVVYVCMCVHSYLPPRTLELQNRDTNGFITIQGSF